MLRQIVMEMIRDASIYGPSWLSRAAIAFFLFNLTFGFMGWVAFTDQPFLQWLFFLGNKGEQVPVKLFIVMTLLTWFSVVYVLWRIGGRYGQRVQHKGVSIVVER